MSETSYQRIYNIQTIDNVVVHDNEVITIVGQLSHCIEDDGSLPKDSPGYTLSFEKCSGGGKKGITFSLKVEGGEVVYKKESSSNYNCRDDGGGRRQTSAAVVEYDYSVNSTQLYFESTCTSSYFGLGARFSQPNLKGLEVQVCHPTGITSNSSCASGSSSSGVNGGSGTQQYYSPKSTYNSSTIPHFIHLQSNVSTHLHNVEPSIFDFTADNWYSIRTVCNVICGTFLVASSPLELCTLYTSPTASSGTSASGGVGRPKLLPNWVMKNGILVGLQGGTMAVQDVMKVLFRFKTNVAGVLIKDWTGSKCNQTSSSSSSAANQGKCHGNNPSWYNYVLERETYPQWQPFVDSLERRGISVGLYMTPYLEEIPMHLRSGRRYLFGEVNGNDYFVKKQLAVRNKTKRNNKKDKQQATTTTTSMYSHFKNNKCGILDPTNYKATSWYKQVVKDEVYNYAGASFWLADMSMGGPSLDGLYTSGPAAAAVAQAHATTPAVPISSCSSSAGLSYHNTYAEQWAKINRDAIKEAGREGDSFFIVNAAYGSAAKYASATSLGDHVANFHNEDGSILRSIIHGIVNGGLSGLTYGHCAVNMAVPRQLSNSLGQNIDTKSREMICRWFEFTAFTTIFRTHDGDASVMNHDNMMSSGNNKNGENMLSAYDDEVVLKSLARWSQVYVALAKYRLRLLNEASYRGYPVVRHPMLHFPNDDNFNGSTRGVVIGSSGKKKKKVDEDVAASTLSSFMMGDVIYVVPILKSGVVTSRVYLPEGGWIHLWVSYIYSDADSCIEEVLLLTHHFLAFHSSRHTLVT